MWKSIVLDVECIVCNKSLQKISHDPEEVCRKMRKIISRRSRTPNWSLEEKLYLLDLIKDRKDAVVTKNNCGPIHCEEKDEAWNEIMQELCVKFGNKFTSMSLTKVKTQWQNMKRIAREELAVHGAEIEKYSKQSFEVCQIIGLIKDGEIVKNVNMNASSETQPPEIEIKAERLDDDYNEPNSSETTNNITNTIVNQNEKDQHENLSVFDSSASSVSECYDNENQEQKTTNNPEKVSLKRNASVMTQNTEPITHVSQLQRQMQEFFKYTALEKQIKMDSLCEERKIITAMRETAELNKIIAEQKLKHLLWINKQETEMYSGELGSGAGKGGGDGGSIRSAGGSFGKMEAAREEEYFYKKQKEQIANMKSHLDKEIAFHQDQIKRHEDAIRRHKEQQSEMEKK